ncbi:conserved unknown protein [Ectocarpus siliculosus]|uniref:PHD-type domain-containing protein n=1 Tax=Ectocarpus siliculosus TaxID=2880 RepID=D7FR56_ECTSI|nr:conserved unknown protein [Ectocarpus siliculosus]|eukprot:CBJ26123.1 conserved unknown protein [Ectocarpus siliculosus]
MYPSELVRKNLESSSDEEETGWDPEREEDGCDDGDDDDAADSGEAEEDVTEVGPIAVPQDLERSRRGADRAAFKNRWKTVQERVRGIRHTRKPSPKPSLEECVAILDEAASLPPPEQAPGEDFVDQAQQSVALIWDMVTKAREWVANVADVLNPGLDPRKVNGDNAASIADLQRLLSEANSLNVSVAEADEVARIIHAAVEWQRKVDEILTTLQAPVRGRAGRSNCVQLSTLRNVLDEAELIPVHLDQRLQLQERVESTTALAATIAEVFPSGRRLKPQPALATAQTLMDKVKASGLDFPESSRLKKHLAAVNDWLSKARAALAGSIQLRELDKLLTEADKLAVDPGPKLSELRAKMDKARVWLDKVRKAVPKQRSTRRNAPDAEAEKVDLSHVKGLLSSSSTTGVEMDMKEFSHTNDLIENAEEWMTRVKDMLESGEPTTLQALEALLIEAEGIPVQMEEQQLLTVGIKSRQWRIRVDATLAAGKSKLHSLQDLATEGATLRAGFPKDAKNHRVYAFLDESKLQALIKRGKAWTTKAKNCIQSMQTGRVMSAAHLLNLLEEAKSIKVNLSPEVDSLRQAVKDLCEWRADYEHILRPLGLCSGLPPLHGRGPNTANATSSDACSNHAGPEGGGEASIAKMDVDGNTSQGDTREIGSYGAGGGGAGSRGAGEKITLQNLSACIHAAEKIAVGRSLKEVREMRAVLQRANDWIEQCQSLCPRRQSKRRVQPSSKPTFDRLKSLIAQGLASPVGVTDEVNRVRRHIAEAESCQQSAQSVIDKACSDLADQTVERKELWRKEDEECRHRGNSRQEKQPSENPKDSAQRSVQAAEGDKNDENRQGKPAGAGNDGDSDDESDDVDREDELDEAEEAIGKALEQLLLTSRDITVFMPEELVAEKVQKIIGWARSVRESASFAGDGLQLSQAKDIVKVGKGVLGLNVDNELEGKALTPSIVKSLEVVIDCYQGKVEEIQKKLKKAEAWMAKAKELVGREAVTMEDFENLLKTAEDVGVENEDMSKKIRAEMGRCRAWGVKADSALEGPKLGLNALKKLIVEGEKIKTSGKKLKDLKHQQKLALRWTTRLKKTGIEKGTASINELKSMIPEAADIRVDLTDDIRVLKQATCSYCICSRPGEDLGPLVDCKKCGEGYHQICMGISPEKAAALEASEEGFKCIRCRISSLFTSAEQAMLTAMKRWMPSTCFADQAGFDEAPLGDVSGAPGRDRWQSSQNFAALAGVVRDAMNLPRKKIRTSLGVLSEVDNNINALSTLPWGKTASGEEQHQHARAMLCSLRVLLWCTMAQWAVRKPPSVILLYDLVSQGSQLTQVDHNLLETLGHMAKRASLWEASVRDAFRGPAENVDSLIDVDTLQKLLEEAKHIPVLLSLEPKVVAALDDGGNRYCLCRGPNDGTFMVQCDDCDQWFHGSCVNLKEGDKSLNNFECPGCAKKKGGQYTHGTIDMNALKERGVAAAAVAPVEAAPQGEEETGGDDPVSNTCMWPPPEAEYFFGTLDLTQLAGSDPGPPPAPEPEPPASGIMHAASEAYRFQEMPRMAIAASQAPTVEPETTQHMAPQYPVQQYLPAAGASPTGPPPYGGLAYYQHYPHAVDPYSPHSTDHYGPHMAAPQQQALPPDPYAFATAGRPVVERTPEGGEGARKRAAEGAAATIATAGIKRARTDENPPS